MGRKIGNFEGLIIVPMILLAGLSLAIIGSISPQLVMMQASFFGVGFVVFFLLTFIDNDIFKSLAWPLYIAALLFLGLSFFGTSIRGATRWIEIGSLQIQPSELVKPFLVIVQATFLSRYPPKSFTQIAFFLGLFFIPFFLVFRQPDLGNSVIYLGTMLGLLYIAGIPGRYIVGFLGIFTILLPILWGAIKDYQRLRMITFFNPYLDMGGAGYNAIQAMIAVGSGHLFGRGLGRGPQSQLRFLPENHTDFIFASLTEELGFLAAIMLLISYFILLLQLLRVGREGSSDFGQLVAFGAFIQLFLHVVINIGMNLGLLPITGITLPLVSYGGSSILATFILLGLVHSEVMRIKRHKTIAIG